MYAFHPCKFCKIAPINFVIVFLQEIRKYTDSNNYVPLTVGSLYFFEGSVFPDYSIMIFFICKDTRYYHGEDHRF